MASCTAKTAVSAIFFFALISLNIDARSTAVKKNAPLRVCAFNIEVFGETKFAKTHVVDILKKIVLQYDLVMIMEIRDKSETVIYNFLEVVNRETPDDPFALDVSIRLGRPTSHTREQYAFMYRPSKLELTDVYQWPDVEDYYMRPPYVARFKAKNNEMKDFGFIPNHVAPDFVVQEMNAMVGLYDEMSERWDLEDFIIGGDFNTGCRYLSKKRRRELLMVKDERFKWVLDETSNTTTKNTTCPYDNFILVGNKMHKAYVEDSGIVHRFDLEMGLTYEETIEVSDHYPVAMTLR